MNITIEFQRTELKELKLNVDADASVTLADAMCVFQACSETFFTALAQKMILNGVDINACSEADVVEFASNVQLKELVGLHSKEG